MRRIVTILCTLVFISFTSLFAQNTAREVKETLGDFSYMAPADWTLGKIEGMEYQMIRLKKLGFSPNVNFYQETNPYTFEKYYQLNVADMKANTPNFTIIESSEFITDNKLKGKKLICSNTQGGQNLVQVYYFLDRKNKQKTIITGTAPLTDKDKYLPVFDAIAKSFKTTK
jgi:hypothetical protein